jgi:hypothetical protein
VAVVPQFGRLYSKSCICKKKSHPIFCKIHLYFVVETIANKVIIKENNTVNLFRRKDPVLLTLALRLASAPRAIWQTLSHRFTNKAVTSIASKLDIMTECWLAIDFISVTVVIADLIPTIQQTFRG